MKDFLSNIFTKIKSQGDIIVNSSHLMNYSWYHIKEDFEKNKTVYIFRKSGELIISINGDITKAKWESIDHATNSIVLEIGEKSTLFNIIYLTSDYLIIQKDGTDKIEVFIKQQRYQSQLTKKIGENTIDVIFRDLNKYLNDYNTNKAQDIDTTHNQELEVKNLLGQQLTQASQFDLQYEVERIKEEVHNKISYSTQNTENHKFDYLAEIREIYKRGVSINKVDEVALILELQEIEESLLGDGLLCANCKSLGSTYNNGVCDECVNHNQHSSYKRLKDFPEYNSLDNRTKADILKFNIFYRNEKYIYKEHKYSKLKDAINYAKTVEGEN